MNISEKRENQIMNIHVGTVSFRFISIIYLFFFLCILFFVFFFIELVHFAAGILEMLNGRMLCVPNNNNKKRHV